MNLIIIYGPPAAGKLTVAKELSKRTGYKLFHNHLTVDLVRSLLDTEHKDFARLVLKYRMEMLEAAAKAKVKGVIFTYCYGKGEDDAKVRKFLTLMHKHRVTVHMVHLYCDKQELMRRVKDPSRRQFRKIHKVTKLSRVLGEHDFFSLYCRNDLRIDNTALSPKQVATRIIKHYDIKKLGVGESHH